MPFIRVGIYEGRSVEEKRELASALTAETVRVLGCKPESVTLIIDDHPKENWASGGVLASDR